MNEDLAYVTRIVAENIRDGIDKACDVIDPFPDEEILSQSEVAETRPEDGVVVYVYNGVAYYITIRKAGEPL